MSVPETGASDGDATRIHRVPAPRARREPSHPRRRRRRARRRRRGRGRRRRRRPSPSNLGSVGSSPATSASPPTRRRRRLRRTALFSRRVRARRVRQRDASVRGRSVVEKRDDRVARGARGVNASRAALSASRHVGAPRRPVSRVRVDLDVAAEPPRSSSCPRSAPTSARVADGGATLPSSSPRVPAPRARLVVSTTTVAIVRRANEMQSE